MLYVLCSLIFMARSTVLLLLHASNLAHPNKLTSSRVLIPTHLRTCCHMSEEPRAMHLIFHHFFVFHNTHPCSSWPDFVFAQTKDCPIFFKFLFAHFYASIVRILRASHGKIISHPYPYPYPYPALVPACRPAVLSGASRILTQLVFGWGCQFPAPLPCAFYFRSPPGCGYFSFVYLTQRFCLVFLSCVVCLCEILTFSAEMDSSMTALRGKYSHMRTHPQTSI